MKGIVYEPQNFLIPKINIGPIKFKEIVLSEHIIKDSYVFIRSEKLKNQGIANKRQFIDGVIGLPLFTNFDCFFDFPHSQILIAINMNDLVKEAKCNFENFVQIPFNLDKEGVVLSVQTDIGKKRLLLDTGATQSVFKNVCRRHSADKRRRTWKMGFQKQFARFQRNRFWELRIYPL